MYSPLQWYVKSSLVLQYHVYFYIKYVQDDFSFMLQIKGLLRCFIVYEKDDRIKLLIMKVSHTTVFVL
jgi:hypothetical protein